ncbi:MAG: hypothetical protein ACTS9Y_07790 [Methylophilus sp.]|uniref:hypothetical protein n=1 Tax=Methylophilus sp. TaxID=29541 RepID=UPI003F9FD3F1
MTVIPNHVSATAPLSATALRFEIIKRLAPGFRHRMLGRMQPIALLSHLLSKKIQAGQTEPEFLLNRLQEMKASLNAATAATLDLFSWLNPDNESVQALNEVVEECLDLLKMDIYTSNVFFHNLIDSQSLVKVSKVRQVFVACVLTYIDTTEKTAKVTLSTKQVAEDLVIEMTLQPTEGEATTVNCEGVFVDWEAIQLICEDAQFLKEQQRVVISNLA